MSSKKYQDLSQWEKENLAKKQTTKLSYSNIFGEDDKSQLAETQPKPEIIRKQRASRPQPDKREETDVLSKVDLAKIKKLIISISNGIKNIDVSLPKDKKTVANMQNVFVIIRTVDNFKDLLQIGESVKSKYIDLIDILDGILESPEILSNFSRTQSTWNKIKKDYLKLTKSSNIIKELVSPPNFPLSNAEEVARNLNLDVDEVVKLTNLRSSLKLQINRLLNEYGGILRDLDVLNSKYEKDVKSLEDKIDKLEDKIDELNTSIGETFDLIDLKRKEIVHLVKERDEYKATDYDIKEIAYFSLDENDDVNGPRIKKEYKEAIEILSNYEENLKKLQNEEKILVTKYDSEEKKREESEKDLQVLEKEQKDAEASNKFIVDERIKKQDEELKKMIEINDKETQLLNLEKQYKSVLERQGRGRFGSGMRGGISYDDYLYGKIHPTEKGQFKAKGIYDMLLEIENYSSQADELMEELNSRIYEGRFSSQRVGSGFKSGGSIINTVPRRFR